MFIHIGNDNVVNVKEIIGIVDYQLVNDSPVMKEMMEEKRKKRKLIGVTKEAKSIVITDEFIYLSNISVITLKKRSSYLTEFQNSDMYPLPDEVEM